MSDENIFTTELKLNYDEERPVTNAQEFEKIIRARRSVRVYDDTKIPESIVRKVLSLSLLAPNSSNLQPWEIYWVRNQEKRDALVRACFSQPSARTAAELFVAVARIDTWKKHSKQMLKTLESTEQKVPAAVAQYYKTIVPFAYTQGPCSIVGRLKGIAMSIAGIFKVVPREPANIGQLKLWASKSTALACENFMLGMSAYGFDTCPMEGLDSKRVKKILGLPNSATIVMAISAGKRAPNGVYGPRIRFPEEQFIKII